MTKLIRQGVVWFGGAILIGALTAFPSFAGEDHVKMGHEGHDQEAQDDHSGHHLKHLLKHAKEIGLTPQQINILKAIQLDFKRSEAHLEADARVAELELHGLLEDEKADLNAIQAKVEQLKKAEGACLFAAIKSTRTAMALLTPEQREMDRTHREQMRRQGEGQHEGGMGHSGMMGGRSGMGGMGEGSMDGSGHGQGGSNYGSGEPKGAQQYQH